MCTFLIALWCCSFTGSEVSASMSEHRRNVEQVILDNGLALVWEEDHRQPLVAIEVRINGGLRGEGPSVGTGMTHFIEHMLFKGTPTRPSGTIEQEVRRYGGTINAFTSFDATGVSLFVESRYLKEALEMLADILQHAVFDATEFEKERAVIISEIQMNLDDPDRRLSQLFWSRHFLEHPYRHPILGYQPLLERVTVEELTAFYQAHYQPQNIVIACAGDLESIAFQQLATSLFGAWARGTTDPSMQVVPQEPPTASAKQTVAELPVQAAYVTLGVTSTRLSDPDLYPLDVLARILGRGRSSRLYETIVRKQRLAHAISAWNYTPYDPGVFGVSFQTDPDKQEAAVGAILKVLEDVKAHGVTEQELRKAKQAEIADYYFHLQTIESKAGDVANSMIATGDPLFSRRYVQGIERVTRQQVQEAARRYGDPAKMTTAVIRPQAASAPAATPAATAELAVTKTTLPNQATALIGVDRSLPIVSLVVGYRGGVRVEEEPQQGLSNLVAQLLVKGTKHKGALEIAEYVESLGGGLEPFSGRDGFGMVLSLLAPDVDTGIALLHELATQSVFAEDEVAIQRDLIDKQLQAQEDEIFDMGGRLLRKTLFERHPYRFNPLGDRATIGRLAREDCVEFATRWMVPSNTVVAVFGDVDAAAVTRQLTQSFGSVPSKTSDWPDRLPEETWDGVRKASLVMEREQALIMLGFRGSTYRSEDRYALDVLTAALSGMAGRLFQSVREAHGLSYTLGAVHVPGWDPGYVVVYAATRPHEQTRVGELLEEQLQRTAEHGLTQEEIDQAKRYLIGQHRMDLQHLSGLARRSVIDELYGLGFDAWKAYESNVNAVTLAIVQTVAARYLTLKTHAHVLVGPENGNAH